MQMGKEQKNFLLGYFLHDWQRSLLAQEIRRYAPQVFPTPS